MWRDKAATFALAHDLGGAALVDVIVERSHSCYLGDRTHRNDWGFGCGTCPACELRANGWRAWRAETPAARAVGPDADGPTPTRVPSQTC